MSTATVNNLYSQPHLIARSVLVIDDEGTIQTLLKQILASEGYHVRTVSTARHALKLLQEEGFDVVLSDISLPDADGLELVCRISMEFPHVGVIAMSGFMAAISPATLHAAGIATTLQKPFTADQLLLSLSKLSYPQRVFAAAD